MIPEADEYNEALSIFDEALIDLRKAVHSSLIQF